jgi:tight adherence protein B
MEHGEGSAMTTVLFLFFVLLVITLAVMLTVTRPSKREADLGKRLANLEETSTDDLTLRQNDILRRDVYSDFPVLNAILGRIKLASDIDALIKQADAHWTVGQILFGACFFFVAVGCLAKLVLHSTSLGVFFGVLAACGPYIFLLLKRRARLNKFTALLPDAIDLLGRALRAGHAVTASIEMVGREISDPVGSEFRRVFEEQNFGLPLREALVNLARRIPVPDLHFMVTAMLVQKDTGGNLAEVLDKAGFVIRERARLTCQLKIYTAQGRMTGWILGLLPFIVFALMDFMNPDYMHLMLENPMGRKSIWIGLGLMSIGVWMIRRIVDIKV